ncbi:helix-turn-helix domain-containing protein [Paractinoplanes globisporus]|uniref:Helix-turn-helix domain-containing protein n=1 Tax=Paractinoplanes globisporus TaxID=113565 RepID=A0ABW6WTT5_9ACTN|nr:helix-turn-helix transcriptional regulator [Actinoplanes globisporus]
MSRRSVEVDPSFAGRLKELRQSKGMSLRRLGKIVHCSHGYLWDLESGTKRPSVAVVLLLDNALDAAGELSSLVADLSADDAIPPVECGTVTAGQPAGLEFAASWRHGIGVAANLWRGDMRRRVLLRGAGFSAAAFMPPAMRWLMSTLDERPVGDGTKTVGPPDIEMVRRVTSTFRGLDNQFGGGHVRESVVRFLDGDVTELINGRFDAATGRALLAAVAETTQLAAWTSYDTGMHGLAQRYLVQALRFSAGAGDRALGAEILAAMSHQAAYKGSSAEAVDLARAASRSAAEVGIPAIQAESAVLEAQGHAVSGDELACAVALDRAEKLFDKADRSRDPQWIGYFDEAYLAAKFGHCFASLGRGDIAQRFAARSLDMDGKHYARGRQFNLALLALTHAQTGELEEASRVGIQAADAAEGLSSARARDYLRDLANRLGRHVGLPPVREFVDRVRSTSTDS